MVYDRQASKAYGVEHLKIASKSSPQKRYILYGKSKHRKFLYGKKSRISSIFKIGKYDESLNGVALEDLIIVYRVVFLVGRYL